MRTSKQRSIRDWILLACGIVWLSYFAFLEPTALNPWFTAIVGGCLFGPNVVSVWQNVDRSKGDGKSDEAE